MSDAGARKGTGPGGAGRAAGGKGASGKRRPRIVVTWGGSKNRPNRLTGRAGVLALVVCVLGIALVVPVRQYIDQRQERADLREQTERHEAEVARLREELERWKDPAYVRQQARRQLHFVNPGDTAYSVVPPPAPAGPTPGASPTGPGAWPGNLWTTVREADADPKPSTPAPPPPPPPTDTIRDTRR